MIYNLLSLVFLFKFLFLVVPCLLSVAFITLLERKVLSLVGLRLGPNKVSFLGVLQPIGDAVKLCNKSINSLSNFSFLIYYLSSFILISGSIFLLSCLSFEPSSYSLKFSCLFFFIFLGLMSLNLALSGWSIFSKFSLLGSIRSVSQLISYEASLYLCVMFFIFTLFSFDFKSFFWLHSLPFSILFPFCFFLWIPVILAELNRTPYDFSEGESELVSGFNTEFGSSCFTLIFLSEYSNILFFSFVSSIFFFSSLFMFLFFLFFIIWIRSVLPRFRFDKLMKICWKFFIPFLTLLFLLFISFSLF